jgi:hypothetical protein
LVVAAFADLDWERIDTLAIAGSSGGLATIDERRHASCRDWLLRHGYAIDSLDCRSGLAEAIPALGGLLCWKQKFGYSLGPADRNLDALRDGFEFNIPESGGRVLEVIRADLGWQEDSSWLLGLLSIAQEHSRRQLALGRRFFALLVVPEGSPLVGAVIEKTEVPYQFWSACPEANEFLRSYCDCEIRAMIGRGLEYTSGFNVYREAV